MASYKERGRCRALIVTGCLAQRSADELGKAVPEIDALLGTTTFHMVADVIAQRLERSGAPVQWQSITAPTDRAMRQVFKRCGHERI
jgi:ribosomal protein S12 methylthiotransferase